MHAEHGAHASQEQIYKAQEDNDSAAIKEDIVSLDSGNTASGILEVMADGFGFIRCENYLPGEHDVYVAPSQIRRFNLKTGDIVCGNTKVKSEREKFSALLYVTSVNGYHPSEAQKRTNFEDLTPIFPNVRLRMERPGGSVAMRVMDIVSPIGKGQRGMIVSPPKAGKTTLLKEVAKSVKENNPEMHLIILLIDERPEEVTDIKVGLLLAMADLDASVIIDGNRIFTEFKGALTEQYVPVTYHTFVVGIITTVRRKVESDRQTFLAGSQVTTVECVGLFSS